MMNLSARHDDSNSAEDIYSNQLQVLVIGPNSEERKARLSLSAQLQTGSSSVFRKEFVVRLTDECDPLFYYHLRLNDEDYQTLRTQQGLIIDFTSFPQMFVELLNWCNRDEANEPSKCVLQIQLSNGCGFLNVVEVNQYRRVVHLALKLVPGSDTEVKRYLADTVKNLKQQNKELHLSLKSTEAERARNRSEFSDYCLSTKLEIERLNSELKEQTTKLQKEYGQQLSIEKDRVIQIQKEMQLKLESERREKELEHSINIGSLKHTISDLEKQVKDLTAINYRNESIINGMKNRIASLENETKTTRGEADFYQKDNIKHEETRKQAVNAYAEVSEKLKALERETKDYENNKYQLQTSLEREQEKTKHLKADLDQQKELVNKREKIVKDTRDDLSKAHEIIKKLQGQLKDTYAKVKMSNKVLCKQENEVKEKETQAVALQSQNSALKDENRRLEVELSGLKEALKDAQDKVEEAQKTLNKNEDVINWLNKKLNELELNPKRGSPLYSSTPIGITSIGEGTPKMVTSYSGNAERLREPLDLIAENNEAVYSSPLNLNNNKENKSGSSATSKFSGPRPTLRGIKSDSNVNTAKVNYNIRLPKTTVAPLNSNGAHGSRFPVTFPNSAYFAP